MLNENDQKLSDTFNRVNIKLIPKNNEKKKGIKGLRPISLTNFEYRIFTKVLTNMLHKLSDIFIGDHQTCCIIRRRMTDNICLLRDLIEDARRRGIDLNVILAEQNKAFDSENHQYLSESA